MPWWYFPALFVGWSEEERRAVKAIYIVFIPIALVILVAAKLSFDDLGIGPNLGAILSFLFIAAIAPYAARQICVWWNPALIEQADRRAALRIARRRAPPEA